MTTVYTVFAEFENHEDAIAMRDLLREVGFEFRVRQHQLELGPRSPARDTRLGKVVLRFMTPPNGHAPRTFTTDDVAAHVETLDYEGTSASVVLSALVSQGDVLRVARGIYRVKR